MRVILVVLGAILVDAATQDGVGTLAGALAVVTAAVAVLWWRHGQSGSALLLVTLAVANGSFLAVRAAPWLDGIDAAAAIVLLAGGALVGNRGRLFTADARVFAALAARAAPAVGQTLVEPFRGAGRRLGRGLPAEGNVGIVRGALIAIPIGAVLLGLLASADTVFARVATLEIPTPLRDHVMPSILGAAAFAALGAAARHGARHVAPRRRRRVIRVEAVMVLVVVDAVLLAFAVTQVVAAAGGADTVIRSAGLTYAQHAREGFFQLVAVAATMLLVVGGARLARPTRTIRALSQAAIALTVVVVGVAGQRMALYTDAYGLTVQRLVVFWLIAWIALTLLLVSASIGGVRPRHRWLLGAIGVISALLLVTMNATNPEAMIAAINLDRAAHGASIDQRYLAELSADAGLPGDRARDRPTGLLSWNLARAGSAP